MVIKSNGCQYHATPIIPTIRDGVFEEVSNTLYQNQWLKLRYENSAELIKDIEVMPLGLHQSSKFLR